MKTQKIIKIGNSAGMILPKDFIKSAKLKIGNTVYIEYVKKYDIIIIASTKNELTERIEFFTWLDEYSEKHKDLLKELAKY